MQVRRIGVDIGGTGARAALVDQDHRLSEVVRATFSDRSVAGVLDATAALIAPLRPTSVGVGVPGFVRDGVVIASPNFPEWRNVDVVAELGARLGVPVAAENDANCAAWSAFQARGGQHDVVLLTLGTGVGGGVVCDGRLLVGAGGTGAELGHLYAGGSRRCGCGAVGCLETLVSASGLIAAAAEAGHPVPDAAAVFAAAERGEDWAEAIVAEAVEGLARGLRTLVNIFNPDAVVLTGGVSLAPALRGAEASFRAQAVAPSQERVVLGWAGRADDLAITGAALLAERVAKA